VLVCRNNNSEFAHHQLLENNKAIGPREQACARTCFLRMQTRTTSALSIKSNTSKHNATVVHLIPIYYKLPVKFGDSWVRTGSTLSPTADTLELLDLMPQRQKLATWQPISWTPIVFPIFSYFSKLRADYPQIRPFLYDIVQP